MRFLSEEWAKAITDGLNASEEFQQAAATTHATIQQIVIDAPDGILRYWLTIDGGSATMGTGDAVDPDVIIQQSYETAVALAKGELNPVSAYMGGQLQVSNVMKAMSLQGALQALSPVIKATPCEF